jgi:hypothetical protein
MPVRISFAEIPIYLDRYVQMHGEGGLIARRARIQRNGCITLPDLRALCQWKAPRAAGHADKNNEREVQEITRAAFSAGSERVRIEVLQVLHGVEYPTASALLHLWHPDPYPIIDFRALWTLGFEKPKQYKFEYWWEYVVTCRRLLDQAREAHPRLTMRQLDRALWQYSKDNQPVEEQLGV